MNRLVTRSFLLLLHLAGNFVLISFLFRYDLTGSWFRFIGFIVLALLLLYLQLKHIISFITFIKTNHS